MKCLSLTIIMLGVFLTGAVSAQTKRAAIKRTKQRTTQISEKIAYEPDPEMLRDLQRKVRVAESKQNWAEFDRQLPLINRSKTRTAYIARFKMENDAETLFDVIVVHDAKSDKFYEIRGISDFPWRPLSDLKWVSDDVLQFEQWVNPNNGGRYRINFKTGKVVAAGYVRSN